MNGTLDLPHLLSRCRAGDASAIEDLVQAYSAPLHRLALAMLGDPAEAEEAVQDSLVAAIDRLEAFRGQASFATWLYAITLNCCRGRLRQRRTRERLAAILSGLFRFNSAPVDQPETLVIRAQTDAALWQAIQALDDTQREPLILRYVHELTQAEIAQVLGVTERTVRNRLHAAHERLRAQLSEQVATR